MTSFVNSKQKNSTEGQLFQLKRVANAFNNLDFFAFVYLDKIHKKVWCEQESSFSYDKPYGTFPESEDLVIIKRRIGLSDRTTNPEELRLLCENALNS